MPDAKISPELKAQMIFAGTWEPYKAQRDEYKRVLGCSGAEAQRKTLEDLNAGRLKAVPGAPRKVKPGAEVLAAARGGVGPAVVSPRSVAELTTEQYAAVFGGKGRAEELEGIRWVYQHMANPNVRPEDAPDGGTWGFLLECRGNRELKAAFYKKWFDCFQPTKADGEAAERFTDDGRKVLGLNERIRKAAEKAKGGADAGV